MTDLTREGLVELAERCSTAHEVETRALLSEAFDACMQRQLPSRPGTVTWNPVYLAFTKFLGANAWLDAAATLLPLGWDWLYNSRNTYAHAWQSKGVGDLSTEAHGRTAALALTAAFLRARAMEAGRG